MFQKKKSLTTLRFIGDFGRPIIYEHNKKKIIKTVFLVRFITAMPIFLFLLPTAWLSSDKAFVIYPFTKHRILKVCYE